jgi:hypothetical protein
MHLAQEPQQLRQAACCGAGTPRERYAGHPPWWGEDAAERTVAHQDLADLARAMVCSLTQFNRQASLLHLEHYVILAAHLCSFLDHHSEPRLLSASVIDPPPLKWSSWTTHRGLVTFAVVTASPLSTGNCR